VRLKGWRRFRPRAMRPGPADVFTVAGSRLEQRLESVYGRGWPNVRAEQLDEAIDAQRRLIGSLGSPIDWLVLVILQAPRAARAQQQMDRHPHGYNGRQTRLYELIDFNDAFVSTVLALPAAQLVGFTDKLHSEVSRFCHQVGARMFEPEQWEAIVRGLSREVAVYRAAQAAGYDVDMTDRRTDAFGIDMVISDPETGKSVNVDCKTPSSYFLRLQELVRDGRLAEDVAIRADQSGHCMVVHERDGVGTEVVLLRISPEVFGEVEDFAFTNQRGTAGMIRQILTDYGR